jgi:hypothetical protein
VPHSSASLNSLYMLSCGCRHMCCTTAHISKYKVMQGLPECCASGGCVVLATLNSYCNWPVHAEQLMQTCWTLQGQL